MNHALKYPIDWSYVAGYFDGEGHVGFHLVTRRGKKTRYCRYLQWVNTNLESLEAIRDFMKVGKIRVKSIKVQPGRLQCYLLNVTGKANLLMVLENLIPRLIIKRKQAEKLRQYLIEHVTRKAANWGKAAALTAEQLQKWYHEENKSFSEIAALVGVAPTSIARIFKMRGLTSRKPGGPAGKPRGPHSEERKQKIREAHAKLWEDPVFRQAQLDRLALAPHRQKSV